MQLSWQNFTSLVQNMASAVQSSCSAIINFAPGSVVRAIQEANASVALWLQWLIAQVLATTRLATSSGGDVDTFVQDFALARAPAVSATGNVTFTRYSTSQAAFIPVGTQVKTTDGTRIFSVIADTTNAAYNGSTGYTVAAGIASLTVPVVDTGSGTAGNVQAGAIGLIASSLAMDGVTNAQAFTSGVDAESDAALRARFANYIQTRSRATIPAIQYAITSYNAALTYTIQENVNAASVYTPGSFVVTIDDGSGAPPSSTLLAVQAAINAVRPIGSTFIVQAPTDTIATISLTITTNPTTNKPNLLAAVRAAIISYVDSLAVGATLPYSRIAMVAYLVDPSIVDVTSVLVNGGTADLVPSASGVIKATTASVTVS